VYTSFPAEPCGFVLSAVADCRDISLRKQPVPIHTYQFSEQKAREYAATAPFSFLAVSQMFRSLPACANSRTLLQFVHIWCGSVWHGRNSRAVLKQLGVFKTDALDI
jgi:hypothetical protein